MATNRSSKIGGACSSMFVLIVMLRSVCRLIEDSVSIEPDVGRNIFRFITISSKSDKPMLRLCCSESARKMTQNGGRIVNHRLNSSRGDFGRF
jgi:hypothetical protein